MHGMRDKFLVQLIGVPDPVEIYAEKIDGVQPGSSAGLLVFSVGTGTGAYFEMVSVAVFNAQQVAGYWRDSATKPGATRIER